MSDRSRHVFVTGAGFTRAFVPDAPLLVDDFGNDSLVESVRGLPMASQLLEAERNRHRDGFINIEHLMTRVHRTAAARHRALDVLTQPTPLRREAFRLLRIHLEWSVIIQLHSDTRNLT